LLTQYQHGLTIPQIIQIAIASTYQQEKELEDQLCEPILVA
jgi:hypothetical protein